MTEGNWGHVPRPHSATKCLISIFILSPRLDFDYQTIVKMSDGPAEATISRFKESTIFF